MQEATRASRIALLRSLRWRWTLVALVLGALLIALLVEVARGDLSHTRAIVHTDTVVFTGTLAFVLMGVLVGFISPGRTILEPGLAGLVLAIFSEAIALRGLTVVEWTWVPTGLVGGPILAIGGAWVGELLQGSLGEAEARRGELQWSWVACGIVLGVMLSCLSAILGYSLLGLGALGILFAFLFSFTLTGFFVGLFSPGITLIEPAVAAVGVIVVDAVVIVGALEAWFPLLGVLMAAGAAFVLALLGGWIGEVAQARYQHVWRSAMPRLATPGHPHD